MKRLEQMRIELEEMATREAIKLWRIARTADKKGCSKELVQAIRDEANWLHTTGQANPHRLLHWKFEYEFKYAFKM